MREAVVLCLSMTFRGSAAGPPRYESYKESSTSLERSPMSKLIHYYHPMSRGARTQALLDTFNIPHEAVVIDYTQGEHQSPDYLRINPLGKVPALKHGETIITESGAITLYLADLFPEQMNTPAPGTPERGRMYEWIFFFQTTMEQAAAAAFPPGADKTPIREKLKSLLQSASTRFIGPYTVGDNFSLLDVVLFVDFSWYKMMEVWPSGLEQYEQFMKRVEPRVVLTALTPG